MNKSSLKSALLVSIILSLFITTSGCGGDVGIKGGGSASFCAFKLC